MHRCTWNLEYHFTFGLSFIIYILHAFVLCWFVLILQMWMNVLWALNVMNMLVARTLMALIYAPAYLLTVEMEETAQVTSHYNLDNLYGQISFHK